MGVRLRNSQYLKTSITQKALIEKLIILKIWERKCNQIK